MKVEIDGFIKRNIFTLVPKPTNQKVILCRWHLKKKFNLDGSLNKFKARLFAHGFTQREGIDYNETFAPSSRQESLKAFLSINGHQDWDVVQLDVGGVFLYGELDEAIYLAQPEGFINPIFPDHVWKLKSSLYGLNQSARQWHQWLGEHLETIGFVPAQVDPSMYIMRENGLITSTILVHVNDIFLAGTNWTIMRIEQLLQRKFQLTQNNEVSHFLSFDITQNFQTEIIDDESIIIHSWFRWAASFGKCWISSDTLRQCI